MRKEFDKNVKNKSIKNIQKEKKTFEKHEKKIK